MATATSDEKLCMAIINNSTITNIDWKGVAAELEMEKINSVQKRWQRFRKAKFGTMTGPEKSEGGNAGKSIKGETGKGKEVKKRVMQEEAEGEYGGRRRKKKAGDEKEREMSGSGVKSKREEKWIGDDDNNDDGLGTQGYQEEKDDDEDAA
jgi:hypothetical protein